MIHPNVNIVNIQKRQGSRHISLSSVHFSDMGLFLSETLPKTKGTYLLCRFEPFLFFRFGWYLFAFFWLLLLIFLVYKMIRSFERISHTAAYLQIPYLLWLVFAGYLNLGVWVLN